MASDSFIFADAVIVGTARKVIKHHGYLAGAAGNLKDVALYLDTIASLESAKDMDDFAFSPEAKFENIGALLVSPKGKVLHMDNGGYFYHVEAPFHADGAGDGIARGAMAAGKSAVEAVKIAIENHAFCGGKIQVVKL